jgi:hypothetical protein
MYIPINIDDYHAKNKGRPYYMQKSILPTNAEHQVDKRQDYPRPRPRPQEYPYYYQQQHPYYQQYPYNKHYPSYMKFIHLSILYFINFLLDLVKARLAIPSSKK